MDQQIKNFTYMGGNQVFMQEGITIIYTRPFAIRREELDLFAVLCNIIQEYNESFTIFEYPPNMISTDQQFQRFKFENNEMDTMNNLVNTLKQYIEQYRQQKIDQNKNVNYDSYYFVRFTSTFEQTIWENKIKQIRRLKRIIKKIINSYSLEKINMEDVFQKFNEELKKKDTKLYKDRKDDIILIL